MHRFCFASLLSNEQAHYARILQALSNRCTRIHLGGELMAQTQSAHHREQRSAALAQNTLIKRLIFIFKHARATHI